MTPALFHAQRERWSFFVTLTFAGKVPSSGYAYALQKRWVDRVSGPLLRETPASLRWLSREELGEANGRRHLHLLLGEIREASRVNPKTCLALMDQWEQVTRKALGIAGMARCRVFMPAMQGAEYVLKGLDDTAVRSLRGANAYELGKFDSDEGRTVRIARCLAVSWLSEKGNSYSLHARAFREGVRVKCGL